MTETVQYPAVIVLSAVRRRMGEPAQVLAYPDSVILHSDQDLNRRLTMFRILEQGSGLPYHYRLANIADVDQVVDEQRAMREFECGLRASVEV